MRTQRARHLAAVSAAGLMLAGGIAVGTAGTASATDTSRDYSHSQYCDDDSWWDDCDDHNGRGGNGDHDDHDDDNGRGGNGDHDDHDDDNGRGDYDDHDDDNGRGGNGDDHDDDNGRGGNGDHDNGHDGNGGRD
ncbi:hypothetical protein ACIBBD_15595 [Streptomyces sp. NPDC051315]|uniref:hypothetical protein n=1 Tax=Streptomyces sp. NPDC051315 TaxID=3365650 RepID=UPI0037B8EA34